MRVLALALLLGLGAPAAAAAAQAPGATAPSPAALKLAQRLEELAEPHATLVASNYAAWEATLRRTLSLEPSVAKLEAAYPGVIDAGIDAARAAGRAYCESFVTRAAALRAEGYARDLSEAELREVIAFLESAPARRVLRLMVANTNAKPLVDDAARQAVTQGKVVITQEQTRQLDREAAAKTAKEVSAEDHVAFLRFSQSKAGRSFVAAKAKSDPLILDLVNHQDPDEIRRQQQLIQAGVLAFIERKKAH